MLRIHWTWQGSLFRRIHPAKLIHVQLIQTSSKPWWERSALSNVSLEWFLHFWPRNCQCFQCSLQFRIAKKTPLCRRLPWSHFKWPEALLNLSWTCSQNCFTWYWSWQYCRTFTTTFGFFPILPCAEALWEHSLSRILPGWMENINSNTTFQSRL